jgi:uncharacterized membrane protein YheB (UPF0754 family)
MRGYASNLISDLNIEQMVTQKIAAISMMEVESAFRKDFSKEIRLAGFVSGLTGLLTGFICMLLIYLISK